MRRKAKWKPVLLGLFVLMSLVLEASTIVCRCENEHCPDNHSNFTCETQYKCFAHIFVQESSPHETLTTYGCIKAETEGGGIFQCRSQNTPHRIPQSLICCNSHDLCNEELKPTIKPEAILNFQRQQKVTSATRDPYSSTHSIALVTSITVCVMLLVIVVTYLYLKYRKFSLKRKYDTERQIIIQDGRRPVNSLRELLDTSSGTSGTGSGIPLLVQRTIAREITLQQCVGRGRFSEVFKGKWTGETVAIKVYHPTEESVWYREAKIYQNILLRHENIIGFIAADIQGTGTETKYILVTDFYEYGSLFDFLQSHSFDFRILFRLAYSAVSGLAYLHREVGGIRGKPAMAHCDIKSKNILVKDNLTCAISDLGLARRADSDLSEGDTCYSTRLPTIRYVAPEILVNMTAVLSFEGYQRADMYSFGLVLWEMTRRCEVQGQVGEYQEPYYEYVSASPSVNDMQLVVCEQLKRPVIPRSVNLCQYTNIVAKVMCECWTSSPAARLSALRVKKTLMKYVAVSDSESSANSESNATGCTSGGVT